MEPITLQGKIKIEAELEHLIKVERESLKVVIQEARELGDLKENAEYQAAKERQGHVEGRIMQLQGILANSTVIDPKQVKSRTVVFGATVTLLDIEKDEELVYMIVGKDESSTKEGKISYNSPLGKSLIGKEEGDTVVVMAPKGKIEYQIISFEFK